MRAEVCITSSWRARAPGGVTVGQHSVEDVGLALVVLSVLFAVAALIRRWSPPLRRLFIPTAVIGGFLILGLGPEGLGRLVGGDGLFPADVFDVWRQLPVLMVTVMSASLLLGEHLPPVRQLWRVASTHVNMIALMSIGQFAVGGVLVLLLLQPVFGISSKSAALLEMSFNGGHGTVAGLTPVLQQYGVGDLASVGLGLATIGILSGIVIGTALVNYAIRSPSITVVRETPPPEPGEDFDIDHHLPRPDDEPMDEWQGMAQVTAATVFLGVTIALAIGLLALFRELFHLAGSDFFDRFPLFPFTFPAAVIVQLCATRTGFAWAVNRRAVEGLGGIAIDGVVVCAVGTLSLGAIGANIGPLIIMAIAAIGWSIFVTLVLGRRVFREHWFEHSIPEFGESQGMLACGFMMLDMVDPDRQTDVVRGYSYRQIITRPIIGGGFITALSVPLIARIGLPAFTIAATVSTLALVAWGVRPARRGR
jgi:glutamate:Na+ symporter, ESS family